MARARVRTVVNHRKIKELREGNEEGMAAMGRDMIEGADVPDAPPIGRGLIETGGYVVTRGDNHIAGDAEVPRSVDTGKGVTLVAGWGFPSRFLEFGTIKMAAQPFVTPAWLRVSGNMVKYLRTAHRKRGNG